LEFFWCREGARKSFADSFDEMVAQFFYMFEDGRKKSIITLTLEI
jgi:hypothetical protein